ncbi:MAG: hypothetical protein OS130_03085 [Thermodesulfobacteriota bacterium]|jgi:hypothetical protein|nr:MAG: hypothetical protein OS130_03085 [Thermodesulfobacteriota bacterium]
MSLLDSFGTDNPTDQCERKPDLVPPYRQEAFHRVFLYLQTLNVPEEKARELAREALQIAGNNQKDTAGSPFITEAMRALRELLVEQLPLLRKESFSLKSVSLYENLSGISSMPPLNRGFMSPDAMDLIPWRTFLVRSLKRAAAIVSRPLIFFIFFIFLLIFFVYLTLWR